MVLEKTPESPLDSKEIQPVHPKGNQSWIFIEGLMLKLKLQYFGYLMWRTDLFEKTLMLGKIKAGGEGDDRGWDGWMASLTQWTWVWLNSGSWWQTGSLGMLQSMGSQRVEHDWANELNWKLWKCLMCLRKIMCVCVCLCVSVYSHALWLGRKEGQEITLK